METKYNIPFLFTLKVSDSQVNDSTHLKLKHEIRVNVMHHHRDPVAVEIYPMH
jgi:hypothetical protein